MNWKQAMTRIGMRVNVSKTKVMVTGEKSAVVRSGRYACGICGRGVVHG